MIDVLYHRLKQKAFPSGEGGLPIGKTDEEIAVCAVQNLISSSTVSRSPFPAGEGSESSFVDKSR